MKKIASLALAPLVLGGASYALVWRPKSNDIADANARRDTATAQLVALQARKQPTKTPSGAKETASALATAQAAIPSKMNLGAFLGSMNETASAAAVSIVTNTPGQPTPYAGPTGSATAATASTIAGKAATTAAGAKGLTTISFSQTVQGERSRLVDYMNKLEKLPRLVVIDSMSLTSEVAGSSSMQLQLHIFATGN